MFTIIWVRLLSSYEPIHPTQIGVMSIGKRNEGNLQSKRARKTALYLLNYSFESDKTEIRSHHVKVIRKTITYPGASGVYSFTLPIIE